MRSKVTFWLFFLSSLALSSCSFRKEKNRDMSETGSARARLEANAVDYEALKTFVFSARCTNCHNPTNRRGGVDLSEYEVITSSGGLVIPGNPTASLLYRTVAGGSMPEGGPPLEEFEVRAIFDLIQKGAPRDSAGVPPVVVEPPVTN